MNIVGMRMIGDGLYCACVSCEAALMTTVFVMRVGSIQVCCNVNFEIFGGDRKRDSPRQALQ